MTSTMTGRVNTTKTNVTPKNTDVYKIVNGISSGTFEVTKNGYLLRDRFQNVRVFKTRSSARKRISRELCGDFHR